jgi:hypothetical protein
MERASSWRCQESRVVYRADCLIRRRRKSFETDYRGDNGLSTSAFRP